MLDIDGVLSLFGFGERAVGDSLSDGEDVPGPATVPAPGAGAGFLGARVGLRPATLDGLPVIGPSVVLPNLFYATGHYRNGVLLAPLTAQLVADAMLENKVDPAMAALSPRRFGAL